METRVVNAKEAAEITGKDQRTIAKMAKEGKIFGAVKEGSQWLIPIASLLPSINQGDEVIDVGKQIEEYILQMKDNCLRRAQDIANTPDYPWPEIVHELKGAQEAYDNVLQFVLKNINLRKQGWDMQRLWELHKDESLSDEELLAELESRGWLDYYRDIIRQGGHTPRV